MVDDLAAAVPTNRLQLDPGTIKRDTPIFGNFSLATNTGNEQYMVVVVKLLSDLDVWPDSRGWFWSDSI